MLKDNYAKPNAISSQLMTVDENAVGQRLDNFLLKTCKGVPKSHLYKAIRKGQVRINKGRVDAHARLELGDVIRIPPLRVAQTTSQKWVPSASFPIIYEDDYFLVLNKPSGTAVHGGSGVSFGVIEQLRRSRPEHSFLELVHRLDRETSGLLLVAKRRRALVQLQDFMRQSLVRKKYFALVSGDWCNERQHVKLPLYKYLTPNGERRVRVDPKHGKFSHTTVSLVKRYGQFSLLECELHTGRTHQIRVHLAHLGFPIVGDEKYGLDSVRSQFQQMGFKRMFLHATSLAVPHPISGQMMHFEAPLPPECETLLGQL